MHRLYSNNVRHLIVLPRNTWIAAVIVRRGYREYYRTNQTVPNGISALALRESKDDSIARGLVGISTYRVATYLVQDDTNFVNL